MDNFHAGNPVVDDRTGRKLRTWRDASASDIRHNFDRNALCLPPDIAELRKDQDAERPDPRLTDWERGLTFTPAQQF